MVEMNDVVAKLAQRTSQGRVPWKTASGESSFSAKMGDLLVLISSSSAGTIKLSVNDDKGTEIDSIIHLAGFREAFSLESEDHGLPDLFASAKRIALGTDQKLSDLMDLLDEAPTISS